MTSPLSDEAARHSIVHDLDRNLFVDAGAGTGKTTTVVRRIVQLLATGTLASVGHLAAITFTEAAAAVLRHRIRSALELAARDDTFDTDQQQRCADAVNHIDDAVITTLHGFAQRILVEHSVAAEVPPGFEVVEGIPAEMAFIDAWRHFLDELFADETIAEVLQAAATLRLSVSRLGEVAALLTDRWDRLRQPDGTPIAFPEPTDDLSQLLGRIISEVLQPLEAAQVAYERHAQADEDLLVKKFRDKILPELAVLKNAAVTNDAWELLEVLDHIKIPGMGGIGKAPIWGQDKDFVANTVQSVAEARVDILRRSRTTILSMLLPRISQFILHSAAQRQLEGRLQFHDLLVHARDLLWHNPTVRQQLAKRWKVLVVDEFQDTDPLQIELVVALAAADPSASITSWESVALAPGRVLVVGDPKQSIYGFRGADITLWNSTRKRFGDDVVTLQQNFRSMPAILLWVNRVFAEIIGTDDSPVQPGYLPLTPGRAEKAISAPTSDPGSEVVILGGPGPQGMRAGEVRQLEAADVARAIAQLVDQGHEVSGSDGQPRPMRYDDVAILVPTRTPIGHLERHLDDLDIPYRVESRSLVWATDVVREVVAVLTAIDNPGDDVAVVAALRAPAFACSDLHLLQWRQAGGHWDPTRAALASNELPEDHPVWLGLQALARWHREHFGLAVETLIAQILDERRMVELTVGQRRPRDHWRRLRFIVEQARAFSEAGGGSLTEFLDWVKLQTTERAMAVETVVPEPDDDAVRILTIHGSKGLEFPVVVLAGLSTGRPSTFAKVVWSEGALAVQCTADGGSDFLSQGWTEAKQDATDRENAEAQRLLYVGATRARDLLLVSIHHPAQRAGDTHAARLTQLLADPPIGFRRDVPSADSAVTPGQEHRSAVNPLPPMITPDVAARRRWLDTREAQMAAANRPWVVSPTGLHAADDADGADEDAAWLIPVDADFGSELGLDPGIDADGIQPAGRSPVRRPGGTAVGRAVHAVLEHVPWTLVSDPNFHDYGQHMEAIAAAASFEGVSADDVSPRVNSALQSSAFQAAAVAPSAVREVPFAVMLYGQIIEGVIDLLYEASNGDLVVVDWKTDRVNAMSAPETVARHTLQGAAYAEAVASITGRFIHEVRFVFCQDDGSPAIEQCITDWPAASQQLQLALRNHGSVST